MSRKPSFANLRASATTTHAAPPTPSTQGPDVLDAAKTSNRPASREGRKQIAGFFTTDMSLAMHMLALRQGRSLQALMAEAFNDVLRKHGESPVGE